MIAELRTDNPKRRAILHHDNNNEFVDMTLAADGHLVKVHQFLIALSSPYLKELIKSAQCLHPVIFLNEIKDDEIMAVTQDNSQQKGQFSLDSTCELQVSDSTMDKSTVNVKDSTSDNDNGFLNDTDTLLNIPTKDNAHKRKVISMQEIKDDKSVSVYYTVSNRGAIQMICNRYIYFPGYSYKNKQFRRWRCVENIERRCPAFIVTKDDMLLKSGGLTGGRKGRPAPGLRSWGQMPPSFPDQILNKTLKMCFKIKALQPSRFYTREKDSTIWLSKKEAKKTKIEEAQSLAGSLSKYLSNFEENKSDVAEEINQAVESGSNIQIIDIETANIGEKSSKCDINKNSDVTDTEIQDYRINKLKKNTKGSRRIRRF
ncbi:hypothetical protein EVAR_12394_1 [Eumeta japonica]|uniref:BTB domain-containing protein n=1 Tax=Eumeta variegata TaxID=151549 RepID=A0A4C1TZ48_EUMVA|nr:hypothetical protein EVAR_12394_1 [Eumeta japonica]